MYQEKLALSLAARDKSSYMEMPTPGASYAVYFIKSWMNRFTEGQPPPHTGLANPQLPPLF